jgi:hypothetical protein
MAINRLSARRFSVALSTMVLAAAALISTGSAADAATAPAGDNCSYDIGTSTLVCVAPGQNLDQAVYEQTGLVVAPAGTAVPRTASPATAATTYIQAQLYSNASYGGTMWQITNSHNCTDHTIYLLGNLSSLGWTGISSFKSFSNCWSKVWQNGNQTGASSASSTITSTPFPSPSRVTTADLGRARTVAPYIWVRGHATHDESAFYMSIQALAI